MILVKKVTASFKSLIGFVFLTAVLLIDSQYQYFLLFSYDMLPIYVP